MAGQLDLSLRTLDGYGGSSQYGSYTQGGGEEAFGASSMGSQGASMPSSSAEYSRTELDNLGFSLKIANKCSELKSMWENEMVSQETFAEAWDKAHVEGLVPFSYVDMEFQSDVKHTTQSPQNSHVSLAFLCYGKMYKVDPYANTYGMGSMDSSKSLSVSQAECAKLLKFLAYTSSSEETYLLEQAVSDLNGDDKGMSVFDSTFSVLNMKAELEEIKKEKETRHTASGAGGLASDIKFEMNSSGDDSFMSSCESPEAMCRSLSERSQHVSVSGPSSLPRFMTSLARSSPKQPVLTPQVSTFMNFALSTQTYKADPNNDYCNQIHLYPQNVRDSASFEKHVEDVFRAKRTSEEVAYKLLSLHHGCRVLERDLPKSTHIEGVEWVKNVNPEHQKQFEADIERYDQATATLKYLPMLKAELEKKAEQLGVKLYMTPLPPAKH